MSLLSAAYAIGAAQPSDTLPEQHLQELTVKATGPSLIKSGGVANVTVITGRELSRLACCNLGESFATNPSVDVSYADPATGSRQIRLLGLSGAYVQMLTENVPAMRHAAAPYALSYIPGTWLRSIQVSKGAASVKNGFESVTGQINIEMLKPQDSPAVHANAYFDSETRLELNADFNAPIAPRLSLAFFTHYDKRLTAHDADHDTFVDSPLTEQLNSQLRLAYMCDRLISQVALHIVSDTRRSGQIHHADHIALPFVMSSATLHADAFAKNALFLNREHNTNIALILAGTLHDADVTYGPRPVSIHERNGYASLLFETDFTPRHNLSAGLSLNHDYDRNAMRREASLYEENIVENTAGAYAQYTFNLDSRLILMAGMRADHSSRFGWMLTPRSHLKWAPTPTLSLRASVGKGYRSPLLIADNYTRFASARIPIVIGEMAQEAAWNYGVSLSFAPLVSGRRLTLNAEYYYTDFRSATVIDYDTDPRSIAFYPLVGKSYSHAAQIDASWELLEGFTATAAYRYNRAFTTCRDGVKREAPLVSSGRGMLSLSYKTPLELWQFDLTASITAGGRMPQPYALPDGSPSWSERFPAFGRLDAQITRWFRHFSVYAGGENITGYRQKCPIISAENPYSDRFDPTLVWGPTHGAMFYVGIRLSLDDI